MLVNNAGVAGSAGQHDLLELDDDVWYQTVDANLNAVYLVTKAFLGGMVDRGRGRDRRTSARSRAEPGSRGWARTARRSSP